MRRDLDEKRLLLLRFQHARDVGAAQRPQRLARHHALLVGRHDQHRHLRVVGRDPAHLVEAARVAVALFVEPDAHALQPLQRQRADLRAALADAAGEDHRVEPAHRGDVGADVLAHAVAVRLERDQARRLACVGGLEDFAHVARDAGQAEQAALLVDQLLDLRAGQALGAFEKRDHTRIHVAAARAHDQALGGRESHRRVHRAPVVHGAQRRAVAEMAAHDFAARSAAASETAPRAG